MRRRFFFVSLIVLLIVSGATVALHSYFSYKAQLQVIDQQVRATALDLIDSDLSKLENHKAERVQRIISEDLREMEIGKIFIIRDPENKIVYQSDDAQFLPPLDIATKPEWISVKKRGYFIRILNTEMPKLPGYTLQVGRVMEQDLLLSNTISANIQLTVAILALGLFTSWILTSSLLQPISVLVDYLSTIARDPMDKFSLPKLPHLLAIIRKKRSQADEMNQLLDSFEDLIGRVQKMHRNSLTWSYQMAHELKTPLALMDAKISQGNMDPELQASLRQEVKAVAEMVSSFLDLSELTALSAQKNLHANKMSSLVRRVEMMLSEKYPGRLSVSLEEDYFLVCDRRFLERSVSNLVVNALEYSAAQVRVIVTQTGVEVRDRGPGIPKPVLDRIGEPFNKIPLARSSPDLRSHGLGLAYTHTICRINDWRLDFSNAAPGTTAAIYFPGSQIEPLSPSSEDN